MNLLFVRVTGVIIQVKEYQSITHSIYYLFCVDYGPDFTLCSAYSFRFYRINAHSYVCRRKREKNAPTKNPNNRQS